MASPIMAGDDSPDVEQAIRLLLRAIGEDPSREELRETPERVAKLLSRLCSGNSQTSGEVIAGAISGEGARGMTVMRDVEFHSLCERHLLPFFGRAHVACLPAGRALDPSRLPRLLDDLARRLQSQERLTHQLAGAVRSTLEPRGVAVRLEALHFCRMIQGLERRESIVTTSSFLGDFERDLALRQEFHVAVGAGPGPRPRRDACVVTGDAPVSPPGRRGVATPLGEGR